MEGTAIDPVEFREGQRQSWNTAAAGWRRRSALIDEAAKPIAERLVELAEVQPGSRVLDVAAGYGEPSLTAARRVGPEGSVVASDISAQMLAFGRERAAAAGVDNIEFVESDASSLSFPDASFDAAVSRWGIIFEPDGEGAARRVRGLLKPGGRMAISSWGPPDRVPFISLAMGTVMQRTGTPPPPPGTPGPLSRPTHEALGGLLQGGGFSAVEAEEAEVIFELPSAEEYTTFIKDTVAPITAMLAAYAPQEQEETWQAITDAAREHAAANGTVRFANQVLLACGRA